MNKHVQQRWFVACKGVLQMPGDNLIHVELVSLELEGLCSRK